MMTRNCTNPGTWPDIARTNARIDQRVERPTQPPLRVLIANWLRTLRAK